MKLLKQFFSRKRFSLLNRIIYLEKENAELRYQLTVAKRILSQGLSQYAEVQEFLKLSIPAAVPAEQK